MKYRCIICDKQFKSNEKLLDHQELKHQQFKISQCLNCMKLLYKPVFIENINERSMSGQFPKRCFCCEACRNEYLTDFIPKFGGSYDSAPMEPGYRDQYDWNR